MKIEEAELRFFEETAAGNVGKDWKLVVEVLFAEKSHSSEREKYKIYRGGIGGSARKRWIKGDSIEFRNLRINYASTLDKNSKILVVLYHLAEGRRKIFRDVLLSKDLFIIEENKLISIDSQESLHQYFDLFGSEFMDKLPAPFRAARSDKHALHEEIANIEKYLRKKNKKFLNIVYLSFKFPHFCELYFRMPDGWNENDSPEDPIIAKRTALSQALTEAVKDIEELRTDEPGENLCNYVNPLSKLIFRVNVNLRRVRIFMRKEFTEILSIVVAEEWKEPEGFSRFYSAKELKEFYLEYYSYARKCKSTENYGKAAAASSSAFLQVQEQPKKPIRKPEDEEYQEDGEDEDESEVDEESNEGCTIRIN